MSKCKYLEWIEGWLDDGKPVMTAVCALAPKGTRGCGPAGCLWNWKSCPDYQPCT